ncbi:metallophosphoesterase [Sphingobacterium sp. HJSM2_6]|uniref:metallophosphoesterase n=1 Tax=Sphingobacterium sp. HJSM2_6 TaxID=3366264 RepID=UPI003BC4EA6E
MKFIKRCFWLLFFVQTIQYSSVFGQQWRFELGFPDQIILNVTSNLSNSAALNWRTHKRFPISHIQFKEEEPSSKWSKAVSEKLASSKLFVFNQDSTCQHELILSDLKPKTSYTYRVGTAEHWSEWFVFKTTASEADPLKFIYYGDVQSQVQSLWSKVVRQSMKTVPDAQLMLFAGDIVNRGNNLHEWEEWFQAMSYHGAQIPVLPASGNHDHADDLEGKHRITRHWNKQFNLPNNGPKGLEETCYFSDVQGVRFIVLNTEMWIDEDVFRNEQFDWIKQVLEQNKQRWTVLLLHHPLYSTKKNRDNDQLREKLKPLIEQYQVDLVLQGHDHGYARGRAKVPGNGHPTYVVSVSGPKMYEVEPATWMDKQIAFTPLFHGLEINHKQIKFSSYNQLGELVDYFEIHKTH